MGEEKKEITFAEIILGGLLTLFVDVVAGLLDLTALGWIIATPIQAAASGATTLWLMSKGDKRATKLERQGIKQLSNFLPWVPTCFASLMIEIALHKKGNLAGEAAGEALSSK